MSAVDKAVLREEARAVRRAVPQEEREARGKALMEHFMTLPELQRAQTVGCYVNMGSEAPTRLILRALLARGVRVAVPVEAEDRLAWVRLQHPWGLEPGPRGVPAPPRPWQDVTDAAIDIVVVPGLRFGRDGSRLGQGGGHFDRWLEAHMRPLRVGLAFSEQVVDHVPVEPHDQGMDVIVTQEGRIRVGRRPDQAPS